MPAERLPEPERLTTLDEEPGGFRSLARVLRRREAAGPVPSVELAPPAPDAAADGHAVNVRDAVHTKRAVRAVRRPPAGAARTCDQIVDAGRRAHSSKNQQRWEFIVVEDRERLRALSTVGPYAGHIAGAAAAVALVTPDPHGPDAPLTSCGTWAARPPR